MLNSILFRAKPDQSYEEHLNQVYEVWKKTIHAFDSSIVSFCNKYNIDKNKFEYSSLVTILFHDIGKMLQCFQEVMEAKANNQKFNYDNYYRHELASTGFLYYFHLINYKKNQLVYDFPVEAFSVAGHHKILETDYRSFEREINFGDKTLLYLKNGIEHAIDLANNILLKEQFNKVEFNTDKIIQNNGLKYLKKIINKVPEYPDRLFLRELYIFNKGILHYADWIGSSNDSANFLVTYRNSEYENQIKEKLILKLQRNGIKVNIKNFIWRHFQKSCEKNEKNLIAIAPTGSGKTEAALLWACQNLNLKNGGKIIYLLPTMVTANSIFERCKDFFGSDITGLSHSTASIYLEENDDDNTTTEKRNVLFDKTFMHPVTVATVDQILSTGWNVGKWTVKELSLKQSTVIIDEIHTYDAWTLGLIIQTLKSISRYGSKIMLMSATMPQNLINLFKNEIGSFELIEDKELLDKSRSTYYVKDKYLEDDFDFIETYLKKKDQKILIILNTVNQCQQFAKKITDKGYYDVICYHSKFINKDRNDKEKIITSADLDFQKKGRILISTQAVEVSLDIDYDIMFAECAPPDALIQRAGRVNRRRREIESGIYIYRSKDISKKFYDYDDTGILELTFKTFSKKNGKKLTENDLKNIVDLLYQNYKPEETDLYKEASASYQKEQDRLLNIFDNVFEDSMLRLTTRKIDYLQISVVPKEFYEKAQALTFNKRFLYEVKVPGWYAAKHIDRSLYLDGVPVCDLKYDSTYGVKLIKDEEQKPNTMFF